MQHCKILKQKKKLCSQLWKRWIALPPPTSLHALLIQLVPTRRGLPLLARLLPHLSVALNLALITHSPWHPRPCLPARTWSRSSMQMCVCVCAHSRSPSWPRGLESAIINLSVGLHGWRAPPLQQPPFSPPLDNKISVESPSSRLMQLQITLLIAYQ